METRFDIKEELKKLPSSPGVYLMKNQQDQIIYVGKAINLKNRVRQYFQESSPHSEKISNMVAEVVEFEYIVTDSELEALILECNLIKKHWPRYNTLLKDDKTYPYIKVTDEAFPRVIKVNQIEKDKGKYYGPYTSNFAVLEILEVLMKFWPLRCCSKKLPTKERACLNFHIGKCLGPCQGSVSEEAYLQQVKQVLAFLDGKQEEVYKTLEADMLLASDRLEFEKAAAIRDKLSALKRLAERQKLEHASNDEGDYIAFQRSGQDGTDALFQVFFVRAGKLVGRENYMLTGVSAVDGEVLSEFIKQFYTETTYVPKELWMTSEPVDLEILIKYLSFIKERKVSINIPKRGEKHQLLQMAQKNVSFLAEQASERLKSEYKRTQGALEQLRDALCKGSKPFSLDRIEAIDISNIQGYESVGSMVVFEKGKPKRSDYRKFKLKALDATPNDYAGVYEVLTRRFMRYKNNSEGFIKLPDILFIDGGRGHINAAQKALADLDIAIPVCGMVKDDNHRTRALLYEDEEVKLRGEAFHLVTRIQDEVHRFAVEYHRKLRQKAQVHSVLDEIDGVGPVRRKNLMRHFGSFTAIKKAEIEELMEVPTVTARAAEAIYNFFRQQK